MIFAWQLRRNTHPLVTHIAATHDTFSAAVAGIRRMATGGVYVGQVGADAPLFKLKWSDIRRLVIIEDYDEAGVEGKLRKLTDQFRAFFKKHGRRIATVQQKYVFPTTVPAWVQELEDAKARTPDKVQVSIELE